MIHLGEMWRFLNFKLILFRGISRSAVQHSRRNKKVGRPLTTFVILQIFFTRNHSHLFTSKNFLKITHKYIQKHVHHYMIVVCVPSCQNFGGIFISSLKFLLKFLVRANYTFNINLGRGPRLPRRL